MKTNSAYTQPPVTEAVFEVKFEKKLTEEKVNKLAKKLKPNYPHEQFINDIEVAVQHNKDNINTKINPRNQGYWLASDDQLDKVMITNNYLAIARLAPYEGWEALFESFEKLWKKSKREIGTISISRLGIRFINRIDIPFGDDPKIDLDEYLEFAPKTPDISDYPMNDYLLRITQRLDETWQVNISSRAVPSPLINTVSLLLDIDLYSTVGTPLSDEALFELVGSGRNLKNSIFEKCVTAKSRELFSK